MERQFRSDPLARVLGALTCALILLFPSAPTRAADQPPLVVGHDLQVSLDPSAGTLRARDTLDLPGDGGSEGSGWDLILHAGLAPAVTSGNATLERTGREAHLELYRLTRTGEGPIGLEYGGRIRHDLAAANEGMGRQRESTPGTISPDGVFLGGGSGWYPRIPGSLQRFDLAVRLPEGWHAVSQGAGPRATEGAQVWRETQPQDDIYLIAAPFTLYREPGPRGEAQVWLRRADPELAQAYLAATGDYIDLYSRLIGDYPYAKFALVENFWETGYGMPSFTLLGPRVIRLPFIIHSSYPHEILHNWWGNGVYVDFERGNWSEGLTAYLADHLIREQAGAGAAYRRDLLKGYADYVRGGQDFPLIEFRARHGAASQAIGYGKAAMVFHMLRRQLGDDAFRRGLQAFWRDNAFQVAGWDDLRRAFEGVSDGPLADYFEAWTTRPGAARLGLADVQLEPAGAAYRVSGRVDQTQLEDPFPMTVPVVIHQERGAPRTLMVELSGRSGRFETILPSLPVRLAVDPELETFRDLMPGESPIALSNLFGAPEGLILLPSRAPDDLALGYRALAEAWIQGHPGWRVELDRKLRELPADRPVWVLGWENRHAERVAPAVHGAELDHRARTLSLAGETIDGATSSLIAAGSRDGQPVAFLAADRADALPGLARKLPHYGKYGYLAFSGAGPDNTLKGQWPSGDSELTHWFGDARPALEPVAMPPLISARPR